jgi:hypothetical protein
MNEFDEYQKWRDGGLTPTELYARGKVDGLDPIALIRMLRKVCGMSLAEAKQVSGAAAAWDARQDVTVGRRVFWEEGDDEGLLLHEAVVKRLDGDRVQLEGHKSYHVNATGLKMVDRPAPNSVPIDVFDRPLADRISQLLVYSMDAGKASCRLADK